MNWRQARLILRRMDWSMVLGISVLLFSGVMFIFSASFRGEDLPVGSFHEKQLGWIALGAFCYLTLVLVDYHHLRDATWWLYGISIVLLVLVLVMGKKVYGAYRWLNLFGVQIQPSELAKVATMLALARFWGRPGRDPTEPRAIVATFAIIALPAALILKEPDLGTAAVLLPLAFIMMFAAGVPLRSLALLIVIGLVLAPFSWFFLGEYQKERILVFLDPGRDPLGAGWNKIQSEIAVGSGGLWGKGYLNGTQNVLGFLPRTVAPTDFIFSVIAEEMGFMGSVGLLALYAVVLFGGIRTAVSSRDKLGRMMAVGVIGLLFCHTFVNIAMTIGLLPITGLPLPLISYGGSFMISTMCGLGIVQSVYVRRNRR